LKICNKNIIRVNVPYFIPIHGIFIFTNIIINEKTISYKTNNNLLEDIFYKRYVTTVHFYTIDNGELIRISVGGNQDMIISELISTEIIPPHTFEYQATLLSIVREKKYTRVLKKIGG